MNSPKTHTPILLLLLLLTSLLSSSSSTDLTTLVYKGCANQNFQPPSQTTYTQNLKTLFTSLLSQPTKPFFSSTSGTPPTSITGLYQCRGDLSTSDCSTCVSKLPSLTQKLCGSQVIAARLQLNGCYLRYEVSGFPQVSGTQLLYKICSKNKGSDGFEGKRDSAFGKMESGIKTNGSNSSSSSSGDGLFYVGSFEGVYVLGQCEGDLGSSDCVDCVKSACGKAASECGDSASGQIYLQKCYINYNFYANGVPNLISQSGNVESSHHTTQKTVAIVVGGVAAVAFLCVCLLFVKSLMKKRGSKHGDYY